jgi:hypothetical protein
VAGGVEIRAQRFSDGAADRSADLAQPETLPRVTRVALLNRIRFIARTLEGEPGMTSRELAERAALTRRHMCLLLLRLEEHGLVARQGRCWFPGPETVD